MAFCLAGSLSPERMVDAALLTYCRIGLACESNESKKPANEVMEQQQQIVHTTSHNNNNNNVLFGV